MDNNFFPEHLNFSVKNQKELDEALASYANLSNAYVWTAVTHKDLKDFYEENWLKVREYLDKDFLKIFRTRGQEYIPRAWEFYLATVFIKYSLPLKKKAWEEGPDFCIELEDKKVWVEAVACDRGEEDNDPVEPPPIPKHDGIYSSGGDIEQTNRPRALRITSVIGAKLQKYKRYLDKGIVSSKDCLVIAVNGQAVQHGSEQSALFKYAIFGQGPDVLVKRAGEKKFQSGFYKPIKTLFKYAKGKETPVPPHFMEMDEFTGISAVIYSGYSTASSLWNSKEIGGDLLFAYHSNPSNPVPKKLFRFGRAVRKDPETSVISDLSQNQ